MTVYVHNTGMEQRYGLSAADDALIGEYSYDGPTRVMEIEYSFSDLPLIADGQAIIRDNLTLPTGAHIERVEIVTTTDWDSADDNETFNVGTIDTDRTNNGVTDTLVDAATQTEINTGGTNVAGWVGSAVGTTLTAPKLITWEIDTTQPTAGAGFIRVYYSVVD